jgi:phage tail sheath protein FI
MAETIISPGVFTRENDISFIQPAPVQAGAAIIGPTVKGPVEIPTLVTSYNDYVRKFGVTFTSASNSYEYLTSLAVKNYFDQGGNSVLVSRVVSGSFTRATSTKITGSLLIGTPAAAPFELQTLGTGVIYNNSTALSDPGTQNSDGSLVSGSADNLRWEISNRNNQLGTFTLSVRQGDDNTKSKIVLETFNNLSLDPNSGNYIEKVIGNQYQELTTDGDGSKYINTVGEYVNRSNYIRVSAVNLQTLNYLSTDGKTVNRDSAGISYSGSLPVIQSGAFYDADGDINPGANFFKNINGTNTQGLDPSTDYANIISVLENTDDYVFNIISAPGLVYEFGDHSTQIDSIVSLAETRGDCIAVVDLVEYEDTVGGVVQQSANLNSSYAASYWPWLQMQSATGKNEWVPASVVIPGVYAFTDNSSAPWFAPAGLLRGGITGVIQAERRLTRTQRDTLYSAKVNPIASFPGQGISVFGQKTLQTKASALDRVNVRRLLIELKKFIGDQARNLVFEQNTLTTRNRFLSTVNPYLESVVQRQGLYAYRVVMDDTNNTADVVDRNQLIGQIFIQPAKTAEFIVLDFTIEPTGATFAG